MDRADAAESFFRQGYACSQAVLAAHADGDSGLDLERAMRIGEGFAAGLCGLGRTCGAVTGAIMLVGLKHGRTRAEDTAARDATARRVRELISRFERRHGSIECRQLLGCEIDTPEKRQAARDQGLFLRVCPPFVRSAAEILAEVLP